MESKKPHILVVDDDKKIIDLLCKFLIKNGYLASAAESAKQAKELMQYFTFDLVIVDVMMPEISGTELTQDIKHDKHIPIILLTALAEIEDKIAGLASGADDYLTKPFAPQELLLRMQNLIELYGYKNKAEQVINFNNQSSYNLANKVFSKNNEPIKLSNNETYILEFFINNTNQTITRQEIGEAADIANERSVDVLITRLRNKIELDPKNPQIIRTIRNQGYAIFI